MTNIWKCWMWGGRWVCLFCGKRPYVPPVHYRHTKHNEFYHPKRNEYGYINLQDTIMVKI
jgi:hypothetical protein